MKCISIIPASAHPPDREGCRAIQSDKQRPRRPLNITAEGGIFDYTRYRNSRA